MNTDRRRFLKTSMTSAAALSSLAAPALASSAKSPNDRIRAAVIGTRGRGQSHIQCFHDLAAQNVELVALCDVDKTVLSERVANYEKLSGKKVAAVDDMRRILDDPTIDVVSFGTPNHWHALGTIWACQAGKDVYIEKPGTHNIFEGRRIMEAADKYKRIVQHGTQNRSIPTIMEGIQKLKEGVIGRVYAARGLACKTRKPMGQITEEPVPSTLNWDAWLGPAPKVPFSSKRNLRPAGQSWHVLWDYGNGEIGNQGVHELDIIRWALDLNDHPNRVASMGGTYLYKDGQEAPQVQSVMYEWDNRDLSVTFETKGGFFNPEAGMGSDYPFMGAPATVGNIFIGTEGYMVIPDYGSYHFFLGRNRTPGPSKSANKKDLSLPHFENFIKAVRSRNPGDLRAGPKELHYSATLAHLANISLRTKSMVEFDPKKETFIGNAKANQMITRDYRAPYVVPKSV